MIDTPFNNNDKRIVDSFWFNYTGIVKVLDELTGEYNYYIGQGKGKDQHADEQYIATYGTPVYPQSLIRFFNM
jgi:hypothetical protein